MVRGDVVWSAFVADDGSGCYSSPRMVKVCFVDDDFCRVREKTSYGWSGWLAFRAVQDLFSTEREAWEYLAAKFSNDGLGRYFEQRAMQSPRQGDDS